MKIEGFNHVTIAVSNLDRSLGFYRDLLNMKLVHLGKTDAYLEWGSAWVCLIEKKTCDLQTESRLGVDHVAFTIAEENFDEAVDVLKKADIPIVRGPIERGQGRAINFLDPDGTQLELYTSNLQRRMQVWK